MRRVTGWRAARWALVLMCTAVPAVVSEPASALVTGSAKVTRGVVGYGTVTVSGAADCTSAQTNPGGTSGNPNAGTESDCSPVTPTDTCVSDGSGGEFCSTTILAVAPAGWSFDHWSGDCTGTTTSCTLETKETSCDYTVKPPCTTQFFHTTAVAHFTDTRAPTTSLTQAPANNSVVYSDTPTQQFFFHTDEDGEGPAFACKEDGATYAACAPGTTWSSLSDGIHDFCVHATDSSGLNGGDACTHWEQETNPTATIVTKPAVLSPSATAAFTYSSNKSSRPVGDGSTLGFTCSLDGSALVSCPAAGMSYSALGDGHHTFTVQAAFHGKLDPSGVTHTAQSSYTWTVDTTAPSLAFTGGPADGASVVQGTSQTWTFSAQDATSGLASTTCQLDSGAAGACTSSTSETVSNSAVGPHKLTVRAVDAAGNAQTISRSWTVTTSQPGGGGGSGSGSGTGSGSGSGGGGSSGSHGTPPAVAPGTLSASWRVARGRTTVRLLRVSHVLSRGTVTIKWSGHGMKGFRKLRPRKGVVTLTGLFRKSLPAGTTITIVVSAPGDKGRKFVCVTRAHGSPTVRRGTA